MNVRIAGTGSYLPSKILSNDDLSKIMDTSHDWIVQRTGIHQRHIAAEGELTSDMATKAAEKALKAANVSADDIDFIVCATTTPDLTFPATAVTIQAKLGLKKILLPLMFKLCAVVLYMHLQLEITLSKRGRVKKG